jgi:hypothetical protein
MKLLEIIQNVILSSRIRQLLAWRMWGRERVKDLTNLTFTFFSLQMAQPFVNEDLNR